MRITGINIPKKLIDCGLEAVKMHGLGRVVLLAGKNGAGKTRLMNLIKRVIQDKPKKSQIQSDRHSLKTHTTDLYMKKREMLQYQHDIYKGVATVDLQSDHKIDSFKRIIVEEQDTIEDLHKRCHWDYIETDELDDHYQIVPFVPTDKELVDCNYWRNDDIRNKALELDHLGVKGLSEGTLARIKTIQDRWFNATHQDSRFSEEMKVAAISEYIELVELIKIFLGEELERDLDGNATLFGFPLGAARLSDGQKIILQFCLAIHCQQKSLDKIILFMDEPENHLHPSVIIQIIERLKKKTPHGQIWIATSSISLLSYFDSANIWYIDNNSVSCSGRNPQEVMRDLLGDEDSVEKLHDFINLPASHALYSFAHECLFSRKSIATRSRGARALDAYNKSGDRPKELARVRILDYGAGTGRLLKNIYDAGESVGFADSIDYIAYDPSRVDQFECISTISSIYPDSQDRYFNDFSVLFDKCQKESFDIVLMCNVLHEIDPAEWLALFSGNGNIPLALKNNGVLLIVEDHERPIDEKAYQKGCIVLSTAELKSLFRITDRDPYLEFSDERSDGRLSAHQIPKECLGRIDAASRLQALRSLHNTAAGEIRGTRGLVANYTNGKKHAFWVQQYANTGLAMRDLQ